MRCTLRVDVSFAWICLCTKFAFESVHFHFMVFGNLVYKICFQFIPISSIRVHTEPGKPGK